MDSPPIDDGDIIQVVPRKNPLPPSRSTQTRSTPELVVPSVDEEVAPPQLSTLCAPFVPPESCSFPSSTVRLTFAQVITRHGLRTPLSPWKDDQAKWICDWNQLSTIESTSPLDGGETTVLHTEDALFHSSSNATLVPSNRLYRHHYIHGRQRLPNGNCYAGQLTSLGFQMMKSLGERLRKRYVEDAHLVRPTYDNEEVYVRSTDSKRTIETAKSVLWGLYPPHTRPAGKQGIVDIHMLESRMENMYARSSCARFSNLRSRLQKSPFWKQRLSKRKPVQKSLEDALDKRVRSFSALYNTVCTRMAHGFSLPPKLSPDLISFLTREASWEMTNKYNVVDDMVRLGIGRFVKDLLGQMEKHIKGETKHKLELYSGHDNTISPLLSAFKVHDEKHPVMGCHIELEVYKDHGGAHWVRYMYNGKDMDVPGSKMGDAMVYDGEDSEGRKVSMRLVPYETFRGIAQRVIPIDYEAECALDHQDRERV